MDAGEICRRFDALESQRKNLDNVLQEVERYVVPYRGEFFKPLTSEHEVKWRQRQLWSGVPVDSCSMLASHMHGSLTSPAVQWFGLTYRDPDLNEDQAYAEWLENCETRMWSQLSESDFNSEIPETYLDLASLGTSFVMMEPTSDMPGDWEGVDFTVLPVADSYFEVDAKSRPFRVFRRIRMTAQQVVDRFDVDDPKEYGLDIENVDHKHIVVFCVYYRDKGMTERLMEPGTVMTPNKRPVGYKYILKNSDKMPTLEEGGWYEFPVMVPRWSKVAGSIWGASPAMTMLSTIIMLNETEAQVWEARAKAIDPPNKVTEFGVVGDVDLSPGGMVVVQDMNEFEPMINGTNWAEAENGADRLERAIRQAFFVDRLELKDSPAMTATEVQARQERMLRLMAPVLGRLQNDLLNPIVENLFKMMYRAGVFEEMPEGMSELDLDVEYTGPIPRAQKQEQALGMERWMMTLSALAAQAPEQFMPLLDVPDLDYVARKMGELMGVPAEAARSEDEVNQLAEQRDQAAAQMQEAMVAQAQGEAGQAMGQAGQAMAEGQQAMDGMGGPQGIVNG